MYNIKEAAARAGVSVPVLRAWERRYGIVRPARTASGYRQFDDAAVARVRHMRELVADGWSPSAAAAAITAGSAPPEAAENAPPSPIGEEPFGERIVRAAAALDPAAIEAILDDLFARGSFERVASTLLFPALERLGDAWARGEISVAGEHLASGAVQRRLALALEAAGPPLAGRQVVIGLPPGGRHELGALAFAVAARRAGLPIVYLGADLPADDWLTATRGAAAAVIGVVTARDRPTANALADRLAREHPGLVVAFGGRAAKAVGSALRLPDVLQDAVAMLGGAIESGREPHRRSSAP